MTDLHALTADELLSDDRWLRSFARRLVSDPDEAEDVSQDAWVSVLERAPRGIDREGLRSWLAGVSRRLASHRWRDADLRQHHEARRSSEVRRTIDGTAASELEELQVQHELVGAVLALPEPFRAAIVLRFRSERSYPEIARELGLAEDAVRKRVSRGLCMLRSRYAEGGDDGWRARLSAFAGSASGAARGTPWIVPLAGSAALLAGALFLLLRGSSGSTENTPSGIARAEPPAPAADPRELEALERLTPYVGCNGLEWSLEGRTLSLRHAFLEGGARRETEALIGWDPRAARFVFHEFHSALDAFESTKAGELWVDDEGALWREFRAFEPDGSSRAYRERLFLHPQGQLEHRIEIQADDGQWWGPTGGSLEQIYAGVMGSRIHGTTSEPAGGRHTLEDERALASFVPLLGKWTDPGNRGEELELAWGIQGRTVHLRESRGGQASAEALIGWHHGRHELVFHEFVRAPLRLARSGRSGFGADGSLWREFQSIDANGTESEGRQRLRLDVDTLEERSEARNAEGAWKVARERRWRRGEAQR